MSDIFKSDFVKITNCSVPEYNGLEGTVIQIVIDERGEDFTHYPQKKSLCGLYTQNWKLLMSEISEELSGASATEGEPTSGRPLDSGNKRDGNSFYEYPGEKEYRDMRGHLMIVSPHYSQYAEVWFYIYARASHSGNCDCNSWDADDWGDLD